MYFATWSLLLFFNTAVVDAGASNCGDQNSGGFCFNCEIQDCLTPLVVEQNTCVTRLSPNYIDNVCFFKWNCQVSDEPTCLDDDKLCDGVRDCDDGTDETGDGTNLDCRFVHAAGSCIDVADQTISQDDCLGTENTCPSYRDTEILIKNANTCNNGGDGSDFREYCLVCPECRSSSGCFDAVDVNYPCPSCNGGINAEALLYPQPTTTYVDECRICEARFNDSFGTNFGSNKFTWSFLNGTVLVDCDETESPTMAPTFIETGCGGLTETNTSCPNDECGCHLYPTLAPTTGCSGSNIDGTVCAAGGTCLPAPLSPTLSVNQTTPAPPDFLPNVELGQCYNSTCLDICRGDTPNWFAPTNPPTPNPSRSPISAPTMPPVAQASTNYNWIIGWLLGRPAPTKTLFLDVTTRALATTGQACDGIVFPCVATDFCDPSKTCSPKPTCGEGSECPSDLICDTNTGSCNIKPGLHEPCSETKPCRGDPLVCLENICMDINCVACCNLETPPATCDDPTPPPTSYPSMLYPTREPTTKQPTKATNYNWLLLFLAPAGGKQPSTLVVDVFKRVAGSTEGRAAIAARVVNGTSCLDGYGANPYCVEGEICTFSPVVGSNCAKQGMVCGDDENDVCSCQVAYRGCCCNDAALSPLWDCQGCPADTGRNDEEVRRPVKGLVAGNELIGIHRQRYLDYLATQTAASN